MDKTIIFSLPSGRISENQSCNLGFYVGNTKPTQDEYQSKKIPICFWFQDSDSYPGSHKAPARVVVSWHGCHIGTSVEK